MSEFVSIEPATGAELWRGTSGDPVAAITRARRAWGQWARIPLTARIEMVRGFTARLRQDSDGLSDLLARETGRPLWETREEVQNTIAQSDVFVRSLADRSPQRRIEQRNGLRGALRHKPLGVIAVIAPFCQPVQIACGHIIPALLSGNTVVYKPSEKTAAVAQWMARAMADADFPEGLVELLQGNADTGRQLASSSGVGGVLFTGSAQNGIALNKALSTRPGRLLSLDMSGNNPVIAWDCNDIHSAAVLIVQSAFTGAGQRCTSARRLIVRDKLYDLLVPEVKRLTDRLIVDGPHSDPIPFMGPLIDNQSADGITESFVALMSHGGKPIRHMRRPQADRPFLTPGIVDVTDMTERPDIELFGPLLQVWRVEDFAQAIGEANRTRFGLCASLIGGTQADYDRFWTYSRAGIVNWNATTHEISAQSPLGGQGLSGNHRPGGYYAADRVAYPVSSAETDVPKGLITIGMKDEEYDVSAAA